MIPPLAALYILVEPGTKQLAINNEVTSADLVMEDDAIVVWPNPSPGAFTVSNIPEDVKLIEIIELDGSHVLRRETTMGVQELTVTATLKPGIYLVTLYGDNYTVTRKLIIK